MKTLYVLIIGLLFLAMVPQVQAKETLGNPFGYLTLENPAPAMTATDGIWFIRPVYAQSFIKIKKSSPNTKYLPLRSFHQSLVPLPAPRLPAIEYR